MSVSNLANLISVSGQVAPQQVKQLKAEGVEILVCNRPDNEEPGQTNFAELQAACDQVGIEAVYIPFSPGAMTKDDVSAFKKILEKGVRTHMYCRSGARSSGLLKAAQG